SLSVAVIEQGINAFADDACLAGISDLLTVGSNPHLPAGGFVEIFVVEEHHRFVGAGIARLVGVENRADDKLERLADAVGRNDALQLDDIPLFPVKLLRRLFANNASAQVAHESLFLVWS